MKRIIDSLVIPTVIAVLIGYILGNYVYKSYRSNLDNDLKSTRLYLIENGEYNTLDEMREENNTNNYVYYEDDNKYKTVIGITRDYDNIDKIKSLYNDNLKVMEYYVSTDFLDSKQDEYDKELASTSDLKEVKKVVDNILELYRNDDKVRLIAIN